MGYRLKANPSHLYDVFIHLRRRQDETVASVVRFYPDTYVDEDLFASVVKFAFPSVPQTTPPFHHSPSSTPPTYPPSHFHSESHDYHRPSKKFTFVLTNIESKFRFGFCCSFYQDCSHDSDTVTDPDNHPKDHDNDDKRSSHGDDVGRGVVETCYCFISYLPYFSLFNKALDILRHTLTIHFPLHHPLNFLCKLHDVSNFGQSQAISFEVDAKEYQFVCSIYESLQQIPENINLTIMHKSFTTKNLIFLFASLLFERRTLLYSACIEKLSACVLGVVLLMNPMIWQHLFIPILPPSLIDYCSAPMPYVIGMHESTFKSLNPSDYSDAVVVDIDRQVVLTEHNDLELIPRDVISSLKKDLKKASLKPYDDVISRAFLNAMVKLIGSYRNALRFRVGESITFDPESFVLGGGPCGAETGGASVSSLATQYKIFFSAVIQFQCFQQFIQGRLDMLNSGGGFQDQFEYECSLLGEDRWKTQSRYKDWASHMKNRGKVLKKEGKDKWSVFAKKVKKKSKQTWKDVKSKIEEIKKDEENQSTFHLSQSKPPPRPPPPNLIRDSLNQLKNPTERIQHYHLLDPEKLNISQHCNNRDEDDDDDDDDIDDLDDDTFIHKITEFDFDPSFKNFLNNSSNNNYVRMNKKHNNDDDVSKGVGIVRTHFKRAFYEGDDDEDEDDDDDDDDVNIESEAKMRKSHSIEGLVKRDNNDNNIDNDVNNNNDLIKIEGSLPTSPQRMLGADVNKKAKVKSQSSLDLNQLLSPNGISTIETIFHHHQQPHFLPHLHHQDHHQDYHHHHRAVKSYAEVDVTNKQSQQQKQQLQQQQQQLAQQQKQQQQSQLQQKQPKEQQQPHMKQSQSRDLITLDTLETDSVEFDPLKLPAKTATATGVISLSNTATSTTATSTTATLAIATTSLSSSTITLRPLSTTILRPSSATTILRPPSTTTTTTTQSTPVPFPRNSRSPIQSSNLFNPPPTTEAAPSSPQPPLPFPRKNSSVYLQYYQTKRDFPLSSTSGFSSQPSVTTTTATRKMSATTVATTVAVPRTTTATNNAKIPHTAPKAQPVFGSLLKMKPKNSAAISVKATPAAATTATTIATSNQRKLAFIQSDCNLQLPPPNFHLFDPIATGQLILDPPLSSTSSHHSKSDEQLLKEWNLLDINIATEATPQPHSPLMRSHNEHQASIHANHSLPNLFKSISPQPLQLPQQQSQLQPQPLQPQLLQPQQQQQQINKEDLLSLYSKPPPQSPFHRRNIFQNNAASFNANYNNNPNIINSNINSNSNNFNNNNSNNNNFNIKNSNINNSNNNKQVSPRSSTLPQRSTLFGHLTKQPTNHPRQVSHNDNNDNNSFINTSNININTKNNNINNNICLNSNKNILTSNTVSSRTSSLRTENAYTSLNQNKTWEKFE